jgi:hypothetical protein
VTMLVLRQHLGFVHGLKLSQNGRFLLSRTYDDVIAIRDVSTGADGGDFVGVMRESNLSGAAAENCG